MYCTTLSGSRDHDMGILKEALFCLPLTFETQVHIDDSDLYSLPFGTRVQNPTSHTKIPPLTFFMISHASTSCNLASFSEI